MASLHLKLLSPFSNSLPFPQNIYPLNSPPSSMLLHTITTYCSLKQRSSGFNFSSSSSSSSGSFRVFYRFSAEEDEEESVSFEEAVELFNKREYYKCHDSLEAQWMRADEPARTLLHGILQCAVGFHHLFNQNHKGAMMELGEGLCKLRKMNFKSGPFLQFEHDISAALDFIYNTQIELAACAEDMCVAMDQTERSYQLLGGYAAGQTLYTLETDADQIVHINFCPQTSIYSNSTIDPPKVKLPTLAATQEHLNLMAC